MSNEIIIDDPMDTEQNAAGPEDQENVGERPEQDQNQSIYEMVGEDEGESAPMNEQVPIGNTEAQPKLEPETKKKEQDKYDLKVETAAVDVEYLVQNYGGDAFFYRANFINKHCPPLRQEALNALLNYLKADTLDTVNYNKFSSELDELCTAEGVRVPKHSYDQKFATDTFEQWTARYEQLQGEYKRHKDEGVKESTRRAMEDLYALLKNAGLHDDAAKLYSRGIRDYCSQLKHSITMWSNWADTSIMNNDWMKLDAITCQALRALSEASNNPKTQLQMESAQGAFMNDATSSANPAVTNRTIIEMAICKMKTCNALAQLRSHMYEKAFSTFLEVRPEHLPQKWFVNQSDIGLYAILCSMAAFTRQELKKKVMEQVEFRKLLETEPVFIELLQSFTKSRFGKCFEVMKNVRDKLLLDPFITRCVDEIYSIIRKKCLVQYVLPFSTIRVDQMASNLGYEPEILEKDMIELIEEGSIEMRIDARNGLFRSIDRTSKEATLNVVNKSVESSVSKTQVLLLKAVLAQANIVITNEKGNNTKRKSNTDKGKMSMMQEVQHRFSLGLGTKSPKAVFAYSERAEESNDDNVQEPR